MAKDQNINNDNVIDIVDSEEKPRFIDRLKNRKVAALAAGLTGLVVVGAWASRKSSALEQTEVGETFDFPTMEDPAI